MRKMVHLAKQFQRGKTPKKFTNTTRQIIIAGIARGMQYLHNHNIIHRDLKPQNILLDSNYYPYISDFGLSKYFLDGHSGNQSIFLGTVIYEAPEINTDEPCDRKIDVYAFGIILYQIVTNSFFPYPELEHKKITQIALLNKIINEDYRPAFKSHVKDDLKILIQNCWSKSPEDRPSFNEIFEKLSNMNGDNKYLLDDVDLDKFNSYIEYVSKVDERLDIQLDRIIEIKSENQQLKEENKKLIRNNSKLENDYDELIDEKEILEKININQRKKIKLLSKKVESTKKDTEKNDDYEQLLNENENLRNENEKNINVIENLKSSNQDLKDSNKKIENDLQKSIKENEGLINKNSELEVENNELSNRIKRLVDNNKHLRTKNSELRNLLDKEEKPKINRKKADTDIKTSQKNFESLLKSTTVSTFNSYPSIFQQTISEKMSISSLIDKTNHFFTSMTNFFSNLLQFDQMIKSSITIIADENELLQNMNDETPIFICHDSLEVLFKNNFLNTTDFIRNIFEFEDVCLEIKYPFESFDDFYNILVNIKKNSAEKNKVTISVFISDSDEEHHFNNDNNINYVKFDSNIKSIGSFSNCSLIEQIEIPSSVSIIGPNSFNGCISLKQITISSSVKKICENAFNGCYSLMKIIIPSSVDEIEEFCFCGCSSLKEIIIHSSLKLIKDGTFKGCSSLTEIIIPSSVTSIGRNAFSSCSLLKKITIPSSVEEIGAACFSGCSSLHHITFESNCPSLKYIKEGTFSGCISLKKIIIPSSVVEILEGAFNGCSALKNVSIPSSLICIKEGAFSTCLSLVKITIPFKLKSINEGAFSGCSSLSQITFNSFSTINCISESCFCSCSALKKIALPSSIKSIKSNAFYGCSSLEEVVLPSYLSEICENAFSGCSSLIEISIPHSVNKLEKNAFKGCSSLVRVFMPSSLTDKSAFTDCSPKLQISYFKDRPLSQIFTSMFKV